MIKEIIAKIKNLGGENKMDNGSVVCGCFNLTEEDLKNAVKSGANSFEEVQAVTKVGTGCGKCVEGNRKLVNELILDKKIDENEIVCGCFSLTVKDLDNAIKNGAKSFEEVQAATNVGTGCGDCIESNKALVAQLLAR